MTAVLHDNTVLGYGYTSLHAPAEHCLIMQYSSDKFVWLFDMHVGVRITIVSSMYLF